MTSPQFDIKKAAKLGGLAFLVAFLAGVAMLAMAPATADAKKLGQGIAQLAGFSFIGGLSVSHLDQSGFALPARILKAIFFLMIAGLLLFAASVDPSVTPPSK
jgi:peptidoglycan/LPS O-acetylase OafA/YrhL